VLLAVWFMSILEKQLRRVIPDALDLILTPFLTVIITGFVALLVIGPAGRALGDGISFVLSTLITHAGWLAGLLFGGLYSVIVITGVHHSFHAIEAGLLGNPSIGVNFLLPIWAMANVAGWRLSGGVVQNQRCQNQSYYLTVGVFCGSRHYRSGDFWY
jgi:PTS system sucrose-specific IIC component